MEAIAYTPDEIAKLFKISKHTVYEMIKRGELQAFKIGNKMRIAQSEVDRYITSQKSAAAAGTGGHNVSKVLRLAGSHDFLVEHLVKFTASESAGISIHPSYIGSLEGLMMLYKGSADIAAIHLLDPGSQEYNLPFIRQLFVHEPIKVIRLAGRAQGMIVAKGNPKNIQDISDLSRRDVRIVNRQKGSGTRFLLDSRLALAGISPNDVKGYENEEWNHLGAASHIARGTADAALGVEYAAIQLGLDFIPIASEKFDLVFRYNSENQDALEHLLDLLQLTNFKDSVQNIEGYDASELGNIIYHYQEEIQK